MSRNYSNICEVASLELDNKVLKQTGEEYEVDEAYIQLK